MEEDILNYLYQLSCFVGHPVISCGSSISSIGNFTNQIKE